MGNNIIVAMAEADNDPVKELLQDIKRGKPSNKLESKKVDAALNYHNKMVAEIKELHSSKLQEDEDTNPQKVLEKCQQENIILKRELIETRNRLNAMVRKQGEKEGMVLNPVSELNDSFRPSTLAEQFRSLYDNEYGNAFNSINKIKKNEAQVLDMFVKLVKGADLLCSTAMTQHLAKIEQVALDDLKSLKVQLPGNIDGILITDAVAEASKEETERSKRLIRDYMRSLGHLSLPGLFELFDTHYLSQIKTEFEIDENPDQLEHFIDRLIRTLWKMKMAEPPLAFVWQENGEPFSKNLSTFFKKAGNLVVQPVWPTVLSRQGGPILYKGIVVAE